MTKEDRDFIQRLFEKMADICSGQVKLERWTNSAARLTVSFHGGPARTYIRPERVGDHLLVRVGDRAIPQDTDVLVTPSPRAVLNVLIGPY